MNETDLVNVKPVIHVQDLCDDARDCSRVKNEMCSNQESTPTSHILVRPESSQKYEQGKSSMYEGCSNMNASSLLTFFTYMLQQNGKRFYKGRYVTFKLVPDLKKNTVYLSSYSPLNEGHVSILTNSMLRTYTSDIDERIIL